MSAATFGSLSTAALRSKYARVTSFSSTGNSYADSRVRPAGEVIDRVVLHRQRAVAARVGHLEVEVLVDLLAGLHLVGEVLALAHVAAAAFVDRELGVDQILVVLHQPLGAVEVAAFLVGRERENQVAVGR